MRSALVVLLLGVALAGCAGSSPYMKASENRPEGPGPDEALVYFLRPSGMGWMVDFEAWDGERCIGIVTAKSCFAYRCPPGEHLFMSFSENSRACLATLDAGKTYYIVTSVRMGAWRARVAMVPVIPGSDYWDDAPKWAAELNYKEPIEDLLAEVTEKRKDPVAEKRAFFRTEEGAEYVETLPADAGR